MTRKHLRVIKHMISVLVINFILKLSGTNSVYTKAFIFVFIYFYLSFFNDAVYNSISVA
jgi:hypothetical protein